MPWRKTGSGLHIRNNTGGRRNAERTAASFYGEGADKYSNADGGPVAAPYWSGGIGAAAKAIAILTIDTIDKHGNHLSFFMLIVRCPIIAV